LSGTVPGVLTFILLNERGIWNVQAGKTTNMLKLKKRYP